MGYMMCAIPGLPPGTPSQMSSPSAHKSIVLGAYRGPIVTGGAPFSRMNCSEGFPNRTTAATCLALSGGIGWGMYDMYAAGTSGGMTAEVSKPAKAAPWEY